MGRRHDWTLRPELMRPRAVPVSAWPTIADIPQGMEVLDTDGVVKQKWGNELLTMAETAIMLVHNGEPVTQNGDVILVDNPNLQLLGANGFVLGSNDIILGV